MNKVKQIREALGLTQTEFASKLGVTYNHICSIENEKKNLLERLKKKHRTNIQ